MGRFNLLWEREPVGLSVCRMTAGWTGEEGGVLTGIPQISVFNISGKSCHASRIWGGDIFPNLVFYDLNRQVNIYFYIYKIRIYMYVDVRILNLCSSRSINVGLGLNCFDLVTKNHIHRILEVLAETQGVKCVIWNIGNKEKRHSGGSLDI